MIVKRAEQDLGKLMWIKLAQKGFHWHVFVNGDGHSSSAIVWNVCVWRANVNSPRKILYRGFYSLFALT